MKRMEPHEFLDEEMDRDEHTPSTGSTYSASGNNDANAAAAPRFMKQYRRKARRKVFTWMEKWMVEMGLPGGDDESSYHENNTGEGKWYNPNVLMTRYLCWTFRTSFLWFIGSACILFFALLALFAALIYGSIFHRPFCVQYGNEGDGHVDKIFSDAFALSWTTFTTVGYGSIYPSVSTDTVAECRAVIFLLSLESFIGCLYTSAIGALVFGKVVRAQSQAQVLFSDPIVVRYGNGIEPCETPNTEHSFDWSDEDDNHNNNKRQSAPSMEDERKEEESNPTIMVEDGGILRSRHRRAKKERIKRIPFPILEFRLVNTLHATRGGEIMDATLDIVAILDAATACPSILNSKRHYGSIYTDRSNTNTATVMGGNHQEHMEHAAKFIKGQIIQPVDGVVQWALEQASPTMTQAAMRNVVIEEGHDRSMGISRKIFCKLDVQAQNHPYFKRTWVIQHTLDGTSPLLTNKARKLVRQNKGRGWPKELNNYTAVRESIQFNQILVFMSGTSNASASSVYAQKSYGSIDLNVGYKFANALYRTEQGRIRVDTTLVNDVQEQNGGGGEPFILKAAKA